MWSNFGGSGLSRAEYAGNDFSGETSDLFKHSVINL